jgi:hypothetical protein
VNARRGRPARRAVLIVCEGSETEPSYFKALTRVLGLASTVEVEIHGDTGYTDPKGLVTAALKLAKERARKARASTVLTPFEDVWIVFDVEHAGNGRGPALVPAVLLALQNGHKPVVSRPSFEVWYILHDRQNPPGAGTSAECLRTLRACAGAYGKDSTAAKAIAAWALPQTRRALEHGHRQSVFLPPDTAPAYYIPDAVGTAVHRLVQALVDMSSDDAGKRLLGLIE